MIKRKKNHNNFKETLATFFLCLLTLHAGKVGAASAEFFIFIMTACIQPASNNKLHYSKDKNSFFKECIKIVTYCYENGGSSIDKHKQLSLDSSVLYFLTTCTRHRTRHTGHTYGIPAPQNTGHVYDIPVPANTHIGVNNETQ
jgi:hypothetical protein